ncbi:MAG: Xylose isomerase-like TIM barrel [Firmicutes bacterium ADurb.Bin193]|nr:MAG: Xylose isomerase-like TIM barrel [Firmicutes bacterium ADurb.Bin193]
MRKFGLQLYSVRDLINKDFFGTLEEVARIGYTAVEFAGYNNIPAKEMKKKLDDLNLVGLSSHVKINDLQADLDKEIEYLCELGAKYMICAWSNARTVETAKKTAELLNVMGEKITKAGFIFAYHNHDHEFTLDEGRYPLDVLFENTNPEYVKHQPDVFWLVRAGIDPVDYIRENAYRCPTIHLRQMDNMENQQNTEAGNGVIDLKKIIELAPEADFIYEQECPEGTGIESVRKSFEALIRL